MRHDAAEDQAVFGPVPSRRLGMSLGVDLVVPKTCTLDCIYCELGETTCHTLEKAAYRKAEDVLSQVKDRLAELDYTPDYITLAGSGEPTLHKDMGRIIGELKKLSPAKLAVLTNGTLFGDAYVRRALLKADLVVPSLDAVSERAFRKVNRPVKGLTAKGVLEGICAFRDEYDGLIWLEILLVAGMNDDEEEIAGLVKAAELIRPDKIQLNTVVRPPAVAGYEAVPTEKLEEIARHFTVPTEVIAPPKGRANSDHGELGSQVVEMTRRRPCTLKDIAAMTGLKEGGAQELLARLLSEGRIKEESFEEKVFYRGI